MSTDTTLKPVGALRTDPELGLHPPADPRITSLGPSLRADYVIVGSGLTGGTIARFLADAGRDVIVLERRAHLGGNVHDHKHPSGVRIHTYGPHYFRTGSEEIWEFVNRFASFYKYEAVVKSQVDGQIENWPIAASYIRRSVGKDWKPSFTGTPANFEEASLAMMPELVYRKFVKGYSEKQWGVNATELSADLARRFDVREDDEPRLMRHKYQGIPREGYAEFTKNILSGIPVVLHFDYLKHRDRIKARKLLVFTGPIDEFFGYDMGRLRYRGQRREHSYLPGHDLVQPCGQVNNPDPSNGPYIRTLEWKHMMPPEEIPNIKGTVLTREYTYSPENPNHQEYPFPDRQNQELYQQYRARAEAIPGLLVCGRLGEYRYYDMDQAIGRAMMLARQLLAQEPMHAACAD
ncbi:MAG: NAD(P)-binding protein [Acidobacteriia bacterium]|nr:NAD(P)-binding protein [Terriglobia bacterium]